MLAPIGLDPTFFAFVVLPLLIFFARIGDMSIDTVRIIYVTKGYKWISSVLGFIEVMIWLFAISNVMQNIGYGNITGIFYSVVYAAGFASGNFVGMLVEERLSIGKVSLKVVVRKNCAEIIKEIEAMGHLMTITEARGEDGEVKILYLVMPRKEVKSVIQVIKKHNPTAFYWIEDVKFANDDDPAMMKSVKHHPIVGGRVGK